jgi:hypothetical protein
MLYLRLSMDERHQIQWNAYKWLSREKYFLWGFCLFLSLLGFVTGCSQFSPKTIATEHDVRCPRPDDEGRFPPTSLILDGEPPSDVAGLWQLQGWYKDDKMTLLPFDDTLQFGLTNMVGSDSCNQISRTYHYTSPKGTLCGGSMTLQACGPTIVRDEHGNVIEILPDRYDEKYPEIRDARRFTWKEGELWFPLSPPYEGHLIFER